MGDCGHGERAVGFCGSDGEWAVAHAARSSEGSQGCREDADDDLNDGLPSFLLHGAFHLRVIHSRFLKSAPAGATLSLILVEAVVAVTAGVATR